MIELVKHLGPVLQTGMWVVLIIWIISKYQGQIESMLSALGERVAGGSKVKAGPFELGEAVEPQSPQSQRDRIASEVEEIAVDSEDGVTTAQSERVRSAQSKYFEVEDLALRAIQVEFRKNINRQVVLGGFVEADGSFIDEGTLYIVEVKYLGNRSRSTGVIDKTLTYLSSNLDRMGFRNVKIILALVHESQMQDAAIRNEVEHTARRLGIDLVLRSFTLAELRRQFGIESSK